MKPSFLVILLGLPLLCISDLQTTDSEDKETIDARAAVRYVAENDNCNLRKFHTKSVSETKRRAYNACVLAFQSYWLLPDEERLRTDCPEPRKPDCRWFYRQEKGGFIRACSFKCDRSPSDQDNYWSCKRSQKVLLEDIARSLHSGSEVPIHFSHPQYRPAVPASPTRPQSPSAGPPPKPKQSVLQKIMPKAKPKPPPPARTKSDLNNKAELFIQHFHEHVEDFTQAKAKEPEAPVQVPVRKDSGITIDKEAGVFIKDFYERVKDKKMNGSGHGSGRGNGNGYEGGSSRTD